MAEKIVFHIISRKDSFCRIVAKDGIQELKRFSNEGGIFDLEILLAEMHRISEECEEIGRKAVFEFVYCN